MPSKSNRDREREIVRRQEEMNQRLRQQEAEEKARQQEEVCFEG